MSDWSCPSCDSKVSSYEVSCSCGFVRAELDVPPTSEAAVRRAFLPQFVWLSRALVVLRIFAYLTLGCGALLVLRDLYDIHTLPLLAAGSVPILLGKALLKALATLASFVITLGLVDAGIMLRGIQRRVGALDERERASG
ncbi:MAG: hypothetical protein JNK04_17415 [Myxococcales bacterium]|nr:hypothetical protein [Myxococcales bacterium]